MIKLAQLKTQLLRTGTSWTWVTMSKPGRVKTIKKRKTEKKQETVFNQDNCCSWRKPEKVHEISRPKWNRMIVKSSWIKLSFVVMVMLKMQELHCVINLYYRYMYCSLLEKNIYIGIIWLLPEEMYFSL